VFVEKVLPASVLRTMSDEEMAAYRAPFPTPQSRKPVLRLPRELPIEGQPTDVAAISEHDHRALRLSTYPKLLFAGDPGALISPQAAEEFAAGLKNCRFINLGPGAHYLQEDHADAIGSAIAGWLPEIVQASRMSELA
jgi:haloalkane dehalogenase